MTNLNSIHPKYTLTTKSKVDRPHSNIHALIQGTTATIIDAEVGERGYICYYSTDPWGVEWHRIHTSTIRNIIVDDEGNICIETENSIYNLKKLEA